MTFTSSRAANWATRKHQINANPLGGADEGGDAQALYEGQQNRPDNNTDGAKQKRFCNGEAEVRLARDLHAGKTCRDREDCPQQDILYRRNPDNDAGETRLNDVEVDKNSGDHRDQVTATAMPTIRARVSAFPFGPL